MRDLGVMRGSGGGGGGRLMTAAFNLIQNLMISAIIHIIEYRT